MIYTAVYRIRGTEDWHPLFFGGLAYYTANPTELTRMVMAMSEMFPQNEYIIEEVKDEPSR